jgi:corrinoid protein of di/trimethylamine methyltransferase
MLQHLSKETLYEELANSVLTFDADKVIEVSKKALEARLNPTDIIENGLAKGLQTVGKRFESGEFFLMELVAAAEATKKALSEVLEPELAKQKGGRKSLGEVVIGTVAGDIHDIGKTIVAAMLFAAGFQVYDLGKDVPTEEFVKKGKEVKAEMIASSALLTTTLPMQREILRALAAQGMRDSVKVIVGGAPATKEWAMEIGADGYGENATEAVRLAQKLIKSRH